MSHKQPGIESVFHAMMIIKTYCHYQKCDECPFFQNGRELLSNNISGEKCFLNTPDALNTNNYILFCNYVENKLNTHFMKIKNCFIKYKLAYGLLSDWKENHADKDFFQYEHYINDDKNKYNEKLLEWIYKE